MDRGAWGTRVHGVAESDTTEHSTAAPKSSQFSNWLSSDMKILESQTFTFVFLWWQTLAWAESWAEGLWFPGAHGPHSYPLPLPGTRVWKASSFSDLNWSENLSSRSCPAHSNTRTGRKIGDVLSLCSCTGKEFCSVNIFCPTGALMSPAMDSVCWSHPLMAHVMLQPFRTPWGPRWCFPERGRDFRAEHPAVHAGKEPSRDAVVTSPLLWWKWMRIFKNTGYRWWLLEKQPPHHCSVHMQSVWWSCADFRAAGSSLSLWDFRHVLPSWTCFVPWGLACRLHSPDCVWVRLVEEPVGHGWW